MLNHFNSLEDMKVVYDQTLVSPSDTTLAILCTEMDKNIDPEEPE